MQHIKFRILSALLACLISVFASLYVYFTLNGENIGLRLGIKISPVLSCMVYVILYCLYYRFTVYSCFTFLSLILCMLGDLFIGIYDPTLENSVNNKMIYFILGGGFFMIARILFMVIFMIKPFARISLIRHDKLKTILLHINCTLPYLIFAIYNWIRESNFISGCTFIYLTLCFGLPISYAYLRIGVLDNLEVKESEISCYIALFGMTFFNISDILLIVSMFTDWLPASTGLVSDVIYWLAIYLLTISIIRTSDEKMEKGIFNLSI